jgi:hypothetical protein
MEPVVRKNATGAKVPEGYLAKPGNKQSKNKLGEGRKALFLTGFILKYAARIIFCSNSMHA